MTRPAGDGIFCLEGEWETDLRDKASVRPILTLLNDLGIARSIHRDVATAEEFEYYLGKWRQKRYATFPVLYLAMHGDQGSVHLGRDEVTLDEIQELLRDACQDRVVYFGSCLTLGGNDDAMREFARVTGARAVIGYEREVDWLEGSAFEVLLLDRLSRKVRSDAVFNQLVKEQGSLARSFGLVLATKSNVYRVPT